ncbi:terpenoid synthase [Penicillium daleae]|uniref:Terpenoid synthase n=1 Tax=Penicillium daleae TaxID=63821 RepID=A0AAD6C5N6_9EURO|nr:terpenoid synthase [Penicillium daleae]KAJ5450707.1 terpenoid synthase [Penicillium daleae]
MGLKGRVENSLESHGISREFISKIGQCINTATKITSFTYPFVSHEVREAIALYASYVITIDDLTTKILPDLKKYTTQLVLGQSHQHELLRGFTRFLGGQQQLFGQFGGDMIVKGSIEFISAAVVEQNQDKCLHLSSDASDYLVFFRAKTGGAEPFAFFCFPENSNPEDQDLARYVAAIPSIMLFLGYVNDLLSFYKEECNAEDCPGFIQNHSKVHGFTLLQSLHQLRKETIEELADRVASNTCQGQQTAKGGTLNHRHHAIDLLPHPKNPLTCDSMSMHRESSPETKMEIHGYH